MTFLDAAILSRAEAAGAMTGAEGAVASLMCVECCDIGPGWVPAFRSEMHSLILPLSGWPVRIEVASGGTAQELVLDRGMIALAPAGRVCSWRWHQPLEAVVVWIEPAVLRDFIRSEMRSVELDTGFLSRFVMSDPELSSLAWQFRRALQRGGAGADIVIDALARIFMVLLVRNHALGAGEAPDLARGHLPQDRFRALIDHIEAHLGERISVAELASVAGVSISGLNRVMRESVDASPAEFVQRMRLRAARRMMHDPTLPLKEVAAACGFADQAHLSRLFKNRYGVPPRVFRKTLFAPAPGMVGKRSFAALSLRALQ